MQSFASKRLTGMSKLPTSLKKETRMRSFAHLLLVLSLHRMKPLDLAWNNMLPNLCKWFRSIQGWMSRCSKCLLSMMSSFAHHRTAHPEILKSYQTFMNPSLFLNHCSKSFLSSTCLLLFKSFALVQTPNPSSSAIRAKPSGLLPYSEQPRTPHCAPNKVTYAFASRFATALYSIERCSSPHPHPHRR